MKWRQLVTWVMNVGDLAAEIHRIPKERTRDYDGRRLGTSYIYAWSVKSRSSDGTEVEVGRGETEWLPEAKINCARLIRKTR